MVSDPKQEAVDWLRQVADTPTNVVAGWLPGYTKAQVLDARWEARIFFGAMAALDERREAAA